MKQPAVIDPQNVDMNLFGVQGFFEAIREGRQAACAAKRRETLFSVFCGTNHFLSTSQSTMWAPTCSGSDVPGSIVRSAGEP